MTRIYTSILEPTPERAIETIRTLGGERSGIEIRVDSFDPQGSRVFELSSLRQASDRPMIYTRRSSGAAAGATAEELREALEAGFDLIDLELGDALRLGSLGVDPTRIILSFHDFDGLPDLASLIGRMQAEGARRMKIAVTPQTFDEDRRILEILTGYEGDAELTLFGMGGGGLYSRSLAPFLGSAMSFVAVDDDRLAAPGQLTLPQALTMWPETMPPRPASLFAVAGQPVAHSQSPRLQNRAFHEAAASAAYGLLETESIIPVLDVMEAGLPCSPTGVSVTAPLKEELLAEAARRGYRIGARATRAGAANTIVRIDGRLQIDNTDVDGFLTALSSRGGRPRVMILGGGGTARAAAVAVAERGLAVTVVNRTREKAEAVAALAGGTIASLGELASGRIDVLIDTLPRSAERAPALLDLLDGRGLYVRAAYGAVDELEADARSRGLDVFTGLDLLQAQAEPQSRLFVAAAGGTR